jgi:hypothetical protein
MTWSQASPPSPACPTFQAGEGDARSAAGEGTKKTDVCRALTRRYAPPTPALLAGEGGDACRGIGR